MCDVGVRVGVDVGVGMSAGGLDPTSLPMPKFQVDLDKPPKERWNHVADVYTPQLLLFYKVCGGVNGGCVCMCACVDV